MNPAHKKGIQAYQKAATPPPADEIQKPQFPPFVPQESGTTKPKPPVLKPSQKEGNLRKVAKFLILLGQDEAVKVVKHLAPEEVEALGKEIATIAKIEPAEAERILQDFGYVSGKRTTALRGGKEVAKSILEGAFGGDKGHQILKKAVPGSLPPPFAFLHDKDENAILTLLRGEPLAVLTIVLSFLPKALGAKVLARLDKAVQKDLVLRWARMEKVGQEVVHRVETSLRAKADKVGQWESEVIDGQGRLVEILQYLDMNREEAILQDLERTSPELGAEIRKKLFTPDHILRIRDEDLETILRSMTDEDIGLVLLACSTDLERKISLNVSARRLALIQDERELLQGRPRREIQRAFQTFLDRTRDLVRSGEARIEGGSDEYVE